MIHNKARSTPPQYSKQGGGLPPGLKIPSLQETRYTITAIKKIDLARADIDFLIKRLEKIIVGYRLATPIMMAGQRLFRGVPWAERPSTRDQLTFPPADKVTKFQRANRPSEPRFYCSAGAPATIFELRPKKRDRIAVSEWHVREKLWMLNVGYDADVLSQIGSRRHVPHWQVTTLPNQTSSNKLIHRFLASEFTKDVPIGSDHLYKLSAAIAEKLAGRIVGLDRVDGMPDGIKFAGLQYPALAMRGDADNVVLFPEFANRYLHLSNVRYVNIDERTRSDSFQVTTIDFANSFSTDGTIEWWADTPIGLPPGSRTMRIEIENGLWVTRDQNGNVIDEH